MSGKDDITMNLMDLDEGPSDLGGSTPLMLNLDNPTPPLSSSSKTKEEEENPFVSLHASTQPSSGTSPFQSTAPSLDNAAVAAAGSNSGAGAGAGAGGFAGFGGASGNGSGSGNDPFSASEDAEMKIVTEVEESESKKPDVEDQTEEKVRVTWNPLVVLKAYFDIDTNDIFQRTMQATVKGYTGGFEDFISNKPDLYGPFWIATTLIVVSSVSGSFAQYLSGVKKNDVDKVSASCFFFYGYVTLLPLAIWGLLIYHKQPMRLLTLFGIYGYAMSVFIPTAILCTVPNTIFRWCLILTAAGISGLSIIMNVKKNFMDALQHKGVFYLAGIAAIHLGLAIGLQLYFFLY